jgi:hypothetical protein
MSPSAVVELCGLRRVSESFKGAVLVDSQCFCASLHVSVQMWSNGIVPSAQMRIRGVTYQSSVSQLSRVRQTSLDFEGRMVSRILRFRRPFTQAKRD